MVLLSHIKQLTHWHPATLVKRVGDGVNLAKVEIRSLLYSCSTLELIVSYLEATSGNVLSLSALLHDGANREQPETSGTSSLHTPGYTTTGSPAV